MILDSKRKLNHFKQGPMTTRKVSIIVPTFNRSKLLFYTMQSLVMQQTAKDLFEVIVADDGSTDDTREVVRQYEKKLNVKYVFQEDLGYRPGSARNAGILASEAEICVFIDSGVLLQKDCIGAHIDFHAKNPRSAVVGYVYGFEEDNDNKIKLEKNIDPLDVDGSIRRLSKECLYGDLREAHYQRYNDRIDTLPAPWLYFWTCHVSALTEDLKRIKMFDPRFDGRWGVEDNDLGFRLAKAGVKIALLRDAVSIHYPHAKDEETRYRQGYENCIYFHQKHGTLGTQLFLQHYRTKGFYDINRAMLEISAKDFILGEHEVQRM